MRKLKVFGRRRRRRRCQHHTNIRPKHFQFLRSYKKQEYKTQVRSQHYGTPFIKNILIKLKCSKEGYVIRQQAPQKQIKCHDMINKLGWKSFQEGAEARLIMMYKIVKDKVATNKNMYLQRQTRLFRHPQQIGYMEQTATRLQEIVPLWTPPKTGTSFPPKIATARSLETFKSQVTNLTN